MMIKRLKKALFPGFPKEMRHINADRGPEAAASEYFDYEDEPLGQACFVWNAALGAYVIAQKTKTIKHKGAPLSSYMYFLSEDFGHIFSEYDKSKHVVSIDYECSVTKNEIARRYGLITYRLDLKTDEKTSIPPGSYKIVIDNRYGATLKPLNGITQKYVNFRPHLSKQISSTIDGFFNNKKDIKKLGVKYKSSMCLFGPPGTGKTSEVLRIFEEKKYVSLFISSDIKDLSILESLRESFDGQDVVLIFEEFTERTDNSSYLEHLLTFLDGEMSWENSFSILTTNHPDRLPKNIVRPDRIQHVLEFGLPTAEERVLFATELLKSSGVDWGVPVDELAEVLAAISHNLSIDYISTAITQAVLYSKNPIDVLENSINAHKLLSTASAGKAGFGAQKDRFSGVDQEKINRLRSKINSK